MVFKKFIYFLFILLFCVRSGDVWGAVFSSQTIISDDNTSDGLFLKSYQLNLSKPIYRLVIDGDVNLLGKDSLFRVILIDNQQKEHLVYETYPMIDDEGFNTFSGGCRESCVLNSIVPKTLRVEGHKASFTIRKISYLDSLFSLGLRAVVFGINRERETVRQEQELSKVQKLKTRIKEEKLNWTAGETTVSKMTYAEKKKLFSRPDGRPIEMLPNLQGFEYYKGGIFEIKSDTNVPLAPATVSAFPSSFDWRNVHGENWLTPVKDQGGCGSCWAFAATGATEGLTNVYFNQHVNLDLSEQNAVSCSGAGSCSGGWPSVTLDYYKNAGAVSETCFPYQASNLSCDLRCTSWQSEVVKIGSVESYHDSYAADFENVVKRNLITKGPVSGIVWSWSHAMTLIGWRVDPTDGKTAWLYKNSWGTGSGEGGYVYIKQPPGDMAVDIPKAPVTVANRSLSISCVDLDHDNYCNWGISDTKPAICPGSCGPQKDCDDSNPNLGLFDANLNCRMCEIGDPTNLRVTCNSATAQLSWNAGTNASFYSLRIDDLNNPFDCSLSSDSCPDTTNSWYDFVFQSGHTYRWWMHSRGPCDESWGNAVSGPNFTCPPITPTPISFTFSIRLRGIYTAGATKMLEILFHSPSVDQSYMTIATSQANGIFTVPLLSLTGLSPGAYTVYIRDKTDGDYVANHLRKRMGNVSLISGANSAPTSWATDSSYFLKPGDVNGDNDVNVYDIGAILSIYTQATIPVTPSNREYDINSDNQIDIYDIAFMLVTYTNYTNPGD